jgi:hypothetical protein
MRWSASQLVVLALLFPAFATALHETTYKRVQQLHDDYLLKWTITEEKIHIGIEVRGVPDRLMIKEFFVLLCLWVPGRSSCFCMRR